MNMKWFILINNNAININLYVFIYYIFNYLILFKENLFYYKYIVRSKILYIFDKINLKDIKF